MTPLLFDVHATEGDIEGGLRLRIEHAHETTVITTGRVFVTDDEIEGTLLRQTTDGWRGMQRQQKVADMVIIR
jgi:hypothetical protein